MKNVEGEKKEGWKEVNFKREEKMEEDLRERKIYLWKNEGERSLKN